MDSIRNPFSVWLQFLARCSVLLLFVTPTALGDTYITDQNRPPRLLSDLGPASPHLDNIFKVLVPNRQFFTELLDCSDPNDVRGYSVDVFERALSMAIPNSSLSNIKYTCFNTSAAGYDAMVSRLTEPSGFDAVVGDVTIGAERLEKANFTQPYLDAGIVILTPLVTMEHKFPGVFVQPFAAWTWCTVCGSLLLTGCTVWLLERDQHSGFGIRPKLQIRKSCWFAAKVLVFFKQSSIKNPQSKIVVMAWVVFVIVLSSTYTACLSSILTVQERSPKSLSISTLQRKKLPIGYQNASIVRDYLTNIFKIDAAQLVPLNKTDDYASTLSKWQNGTPGGVAAVIDEVPYVNLFLAGLSTSDCNYQVTGLKLMSGAFGFAFRNGSRLSAATAKFSEAILNMSENGRLQRMKDAAKLGDYQCATQVQTNQLNLTNSQGLFYLLGAALLTCVGIFCTTLITQQLKSHKAEVTDLTEPSLDRSMIGSGTERETQRSVMTEFSLVEQPLLAEGFSLVEEPYDLSLEKFKAERSVSFSVSNTKREMTRRHTQRHSKTDNLSPTRKFQTWHSFTDLPRPKTP